MHKTLRFLQALAFVIWLGGMIFFGFVVAPAVFSVLPTPHLAGEVVAEVLRRFNWIAGIALLLLLLVAFLIPPIQKRRPFLSERLLVGLAVIAFAISLYSQFGIERRMHTLRVQAGVIDNRAPTDPLRVEFERLHNRSVTLFGTNTVLGLLMLGLWVKGH